MAEFQITLQTASAVLISTRRVSRISRWLRVLCCVLSLGVFGGIARAQSPTLALPAPSAPPNAEFLRAADEVLAEMCRILALPAKAPLKKTIRTSAEIRAFVVRQMEEDKEPEKRYADRKTLEKLGLIPRDFNLDGFLVDLLTEQIAGLYDPKSQEFYIADWIPAAEQRQVMSHELTHALQDQYFGLDKWAEAAKPNEMAADRAVRAIAVFMCSPGTLTRVGKCAWRGETGRTRARQSDGHAALPSATCCRAAQPGGRRDVAPGRSPDSPVTPCRRRPFAFPGQGPVAC